jgi:hypothetical protein
VPSPPMPLPATRTSISWSQCSCGTALVIIDSQRFLECARAVGRNLVTPPSGRLVRPERDHDFGELLTADGVTSG